MKRGRNRERRCITLGLTRRTRRTNIRSRTKAICIGPNRVPIQSLCTRSCAFVTFVLTPGLSHRFRLLVRVIGRAYERAGFYVAEA